MAINKDAAGLATSVVVALGQEVNLNPGIGWVRGDQVADPKIFEELATAKQRILELEGKQSAALVEPIQFPSDLAPLDEIFTVTAQYTDTTKDAEGEETQKTTTVTLQVSWRSLFLASYDGILSGEEEYLLVNAVWEELIEGRVGSPPDGQKRTVESPLNYLQMRSQFEALGLITSKPRKGRSDRTAVPLVDWNITDKGQQYAARCLAWKVNQNI